jgi:hypothetical protein
MKKIHQLGHENKTAATGRTDEKHNMGCKVAGTYTVRTELALA